MKVWQLTRIVALFRLERTNRCRLRDCYQPSWNDVIVKKSGLDPHSFYWVSIIQSIKFSLKLPDWIFNRKDWFFNLLPFKISDKSFSPFRDWFSIFSPFIERVIFNLSLIEMRKPNVYRLVIEVKRIDFQCFQSFAHCD